MRIVAPMPQGGRRIHKNQKKIKNGKIIQNGKIQKSLEICQNYQYTLWPEVSNPSGSVVSTMFCKEKSEKKKKKKKTFFLRGDLDHILTKMFNSETISFQHFFPRFPNL